MFSAKHAFENCWQIFKDEPEETWVTRKDEFGNDQFVTETVMVSKHIGEVWLNAEDNTEEAAVRCWEEMLAAPVITEADVREEQNRRLLETDWMVVRAADPTSGKPIPDEVVKQRQAIRNAADRLIEGGVVPLDFRDDSYWK